MLLAPQSQTDLAGFHARAGEAQLQESLVALEVVKAEGLEHLKQLMLFPLMRRAAPYPQSQYPLGFHTSEDMLQAQVFGSLVARAEVKVPGAPQTKFVLFAIAMVLKTALFVTHVLPTHLLVETLQMQPPLPSPPEVVAVGH